jgi:hypothetical protein
MGCGRDDDFHFGGQDDSEADNGEILVFRTIPGPKFLWRASQVLYSLRGQIVRNTKFFLLVAAIAFPALLLAAQPSPSPTPQPALADKNFKPLEEKTLSQSKLFEVVPGKDSPWSFTLEPYVWAPGITGDVTVKDFPTTHVDYAPHTVLSNLKWGVSMKGEARYGRWGLMGDGMFVALTASADTPGPIYQNTNVTVQQGMAQVALAYRVWENYRGYVDLYAGARYNYFGVNITSDLNDAGINDVADAATQRITDRLSATAQDYVSQRAAQIQQQAAGSVDALHAAVQPQLDAIQKQIDHAIKTGKTAAIGRLEAAQQQLISQVQTGVDAAQNQLAAIQDQVRQQVRETVTKALVRRLALRTSDIRDIDKKDLVKILNPDRREFIALVRATAELKVAEVKQSISQQMNAKLVAVAQQQLANAQQVLATSLSKGTKADRNAARNLVSTATSRLTQAQTRLASVPKPNTGALQKAVDKAQQKLSQKISSDLHDSLPTNASASTWWVDPIVGVRAQIDITRWLFAATQCDVGGFDAGSQIAWNLSASMGVNWTRNLFTEVGYRYYYFDYQHSGNTFQIAEAGVFLGIGVKF